LFTGVTVDVFTYRHQKSWPKAKKAIVVIDALVVAHLETEIEKNYLIMIV
jgi:hypothetical protein